jgi:hypothetical protein
MLAVIFPRKNPGKGKMRAGDDEKVRFFEINFPISRK